ncbi:hypothetical protein BJ741DRAFT_62227 [Chytriomyces cf. hyalinus JEL632]|nr:hypothetical protein BJ741DRAFT_62227 [Chytriomyces cf. hyalinus JEL632]
MQFRGLETRFKPLAPKNIMHPVVLVLFLVSGALAYECRCMCSGIIYANSNSYDCANYCSATISARGGKSRVCPNGSLTWQLLNGSSSSYYYSRWSPGAYAGLGLGLLALLVGVLVAACLCRRRKAAVATPAPQPVYLNPVYNANPAYGSNAAYSSPSYGTANQKPPSYADQQGNAPVAYPTAPTSYAEPAQPPPGFYAPPSQPPPNQQSLGTYRV